MVKPVLDPESAPTFVEIGHLPEVEFPKDNPYSSEKELLGKTLFSIPDFQNPTRLPVLHATIRNWDGATAERFLSDTTDSSEPETQ